MRLTIEKGTVPRAEEKPAYNASWVDFAVGFLAGGGITFAGAVAAVALDMGMHRHGTTMVSAVGGGLAFGLGSYVSGRQLRSRPARTPPLLLVLLASPGTAFVVFFHYSSPYRVDAWHWTMLGLSALITLLSARKRR